MDSKKLVEAALFISGREMRKGELAEMLKMTLDEVDRHATALVDDYAGRDSCVKIIKFEGTYKMDIDQEYGTHVKKLAPEVELSRGVLKALSFIAYKQPVRQSQLVKLLGNRAYEYVHELVDRGFVTAERWGRTRKLQTTDKFRMYFGTSGITDPEPKPQEQ
ncbi:MAG: SMC-Scp complex subunit ScpB [archaeon]